MAAPSVPPPAEYPRAHVSRRDLSRDWTTTREEVCAMREKMRATLLSARANLQRANADLRAVKAYVQGLLERQ